MTPQQFLLVLWARRKLILVVFLLVSVVGVIVTLTMPSQYTASVSIVVDVKADPIAGSLQPYLASPSYMATQTEIIQSDRVAMRVVKAMHLDQATAVVARWKADTDGKVPFDYYYGTLLLKALVVKPSRGSNIIELEFTGQNPQFAAATANAFAQAYIDTTIDLRVDPARQYAAWFDERLKSLRESVEQAQARLSSYQQEKGIVASDERLDSETARLNALNVQLSTVQGQKIETSTRFKNSGNELSPDVQENPIIQSIKAELAKAETKLSEARNVLGENHPVRQQLETQVEGLKQQMQDEIQRISGGAATATRVSSQKEDEIKALIEEQKSRILALRSDHDQIAVLSKDVESAQHAYDVVAQRMSQVNLESKSEQTNLSVLTPAMPPTEASKPKIRSYVLGSLGGGFALGVALAMALEFLDRRVRDADDLKMVEGVPLLGALKPETAFYLSLKSRFTGLIRHLREWRRRRVVAAAGAGP